MRNLRRDLLVVFIAAVLPGGATHVQAAGDKVLGDLLPPQAAATLPPGLSKRDPRVAFKIGPDLARLAAEYEAHRRTGATGTFAPSKAPASALLRLRGEAVLVDAIAAADTESLSDALTDAGLADASAYGRVVSGYLPISSIPTLAGLAEVHFVRPARAAVGVGLVDTQGDQAMASDFSRVEFGIAGAGITVGTLSDSYNCLNGAPGDVTNGDLPGGIVVIDDTVCPGSDEGRGMMQIVADVAPGAAQAFHTAFGGQADFALGIEELAGCPPGSAPGCTPVPGLAADIVNDDVFYFAEPFYQDGIIAQAVENVVANGVSYFALAGNHGRKSYESTFAPSGLFEPLFGGELHDFDPGAGVDTLQAVTIPVGASVVFSFQWAEPYFSVSGGSGSASDHDIFIVAADGTSYLTGGNASNIGGDPIEVFGFTNDGTVDLDGTLGPDTTFNIAISNSSGPVATDLKYIALVNGALNNFLVNEYDTASGTIYGHMNASSAVTVGAAFYFDTPDFNSDPALPEPFTSAGPLPVLFDGTGASTFEPRAKPDLVAPDGGNTTFFGFDIPDPGDGSDTDSFPNFFGTSAATPHAAGVGALLLESSNLTASGLAQIMRAAAAEFDMGPAGFDDGTGFGFLVSLFALDSTVADANWTGFYGLLDYTLTDVPNEGPQTFRAAGSITWRSGSFNDVVGQATRHSLGEGFTSTGPASFQTIAVGPQAKSSRSTEPDNK